MNRTTRAAIAFMLFMAILATGCTPEGDNNTSLLTPTSQSPSVADTFHADYGRLTVDTPNLDYFTYGLVNDNNFNESRESSLALPKGEYVIIVYLTEGTTYAANVTVNGGMETSVVKPITEVRSVEKIGVTGNRLRNLPIGDDLYLAYGSQIQPQIWSPENKRIPKISFKRLYNACFLTDHQIVLLGDKKAVLYDTTNGTTTPFEPSGIQLNKTPLDIGICVPNAVQFAYDGQIIRVGLTTVETIDLLDADQIATGYDYTDGLLVDATDNIIVAILGDEPIIDSSGDEDFDHTQSRLVIANRDHTNRHEIDLGVHSPTVSVSLAPDGNKVAIMTLTSVSVYDTASAQLLYEVPSYPTDVYWRDNNSFIYRGGVDEKVDFYLANVAKRESYGLTQNGEVNISDITGVFKDYLYFTTFLKDGLNLAADAFRMKVE